MGPYKLSQTTSRVCQGLQKQTPARESTDPPPGLPRPHCSTLSQAPPYEDRASWPILDFFAS